MLVSLRWLAKYVSLPDDLDALADRLSLSGLNHEGTFTANGDTVFDLEVTSNRGDCLGHIGVAREIAVLYDSPLELPATLIANDASGNEPLPTGGDPIESSLSIENQFVSACPRYTARLIRGVTVAASPQWMIDDLQSAFSKFGSDGSIDTYKPINNVVDATNYVLMETGSPLHAFDYAKIAGQKLIVRPGRDGETMTAIDHRDYPIDDQTCVIADAQHPQAIAGVMGAAASEVTTATTDVVIESATFTPLSVRRTARRLKLHSPSSFRYERKVDPHRLGDVSRRVCELILQTAGGTLAPGLLDSCLLDGSTAIAPPSPIKLSLGEIERILGIRIDEVDVIRILEAIGCQTTDRAAAALTIQPPTWRADLTRPADLIEEVARIHGYDQIPEDAPIPVTPSVRRPFDDATDRIRSVLTAAGLSEAMTPSVVTAKLDSIASPWTDAAPLRTATAMLKGSQTLRRSLIPSLVESRALNWSAASIDANLFEIAHIYLPPQNSNADSSTAESMLPEEMYSLAIVSSADYFDVKGIVETLLARLGIADPMTVDVAQRDGFAPGTLTHLTVAKTPIGFLGRLSDAVTKSFKLPGQVVAAEFSLPTLLKLAALVPQQQSVSQFPSIRRDLNFVVDESVRWAELESVANAAIGATLKELQYQETYRDAKRDGPNRKRLLMTVELQQHDATLSGDQADQMVQSLIDSANKKLGAELLR